MNNDFKGYAIYSQFGFVVISTILIGMFIGQKLDNILGVSPLFLIIFLVLSLVSSFLNFYFKIIKIFQEKNAIQKTNYIHFLNFIIETIFSLILSIFLGDFFDKKYSTNYIFIIIFVISCTIFNILIFIKKFHILRRKNNENL